MPDAMIAIFTPTPVNFSISPASSKIADVIRPVVKFKETIKARPMDLNMLYLDS